MYLLDIQPIQFSERAQLPRKVVENETTCLMSSINKSPALLLQRMRV